MEGKKFFAVTAPVSSAKTEEERTRIMICNAAAIGVAKCLNKYNPNFLSREDFDDAILDAQLSAMEHIDQNISTGLAYAYACGMSSAIKKCKSITRKSNLFSSLEYCDRNGIWHYNVNAKIYSDGTSADSAISDREEMALRDIKDGLIRSCLEKMSPVDRQVSILKGKKTPYKDIAQTLGCSTGAVQKRAYDIASRFDKLLSQSGYYNLG